jgi:hypothetical protein
MRERGSSLFFIIILANELTAGLVVALLRFTTRLHAVREWRFTVLYAAIMFLCSVMVFCVVRFAGRSRGQR